MLDPDILTLALEINRDGARFDWDIDRLKAHRIAMHLIAIEANPDDPLVRELSPGGYRDREPLD